MTSILVVDDDEQLRSALARELSDRGFRVMVAQSVGEAVATLSRDAVDVLLTDLRMGDRDGVDLLARAREVSRNTRAILMSAYATARDYQTALDLGAVRVLCKPFTPGEALMAIQQAIECETGFRGSIHGLSLIDMVQMFHYGRRSLAVTVQDVVPGTIYMREGEVVHARCGAATGEEALRTMLAAQSGHVTTAPLPDDIPHTVHRDFQSLILDSLRQLDESSAAASDLLFEVPLPSSRPPPPGLSGDGRDVLAVLERELPALSLESSVIVIDESTAEIVPLHGASVAPAVGAEIRALAQTAARVAGRVHKLEWIGERTGFASIACNQGRTLLAVIGSLGGRYAALRFRAEVGRVALAISRLNAT
jgi:DNA-binding response OmpR family regulator